MAWHDYDSGPGSALSSTRGEITATRRQEAYSPVSDEYLENHPHNRVRRAQRWLVKRMQPNGSTGKWDPEDRKIMVRYLWWRDDRRCGLCALRMVRDDAQIEHVVPKKFGLFDLQRTGRGLRAIAGREWQTRLHHPDNLQVAHAYCNRSKGNTPDPSKWRHPELRPLPAAENMAGAGYLWLPSRAGRSDTRNGDLPGRRQTLRNSHRRQTEHPSTARSRVAPLAHQPDEELLQMLKAWRIAKARANGKPAYTVLTDRTLQELVSSRPLRMEDLAKVHGIGSAKLETYGREILQVIGRRR